MIPCEACMVVLDGGGGRCVLHEEWFSIAVWISAGVATDWPSFAEVPPRESITAYTERSDLVYQATRAALGPARADLVKLTRYAGPLYLAFRHFRFDYRRGDRLEYSRLVQAILLGELERLGLVRPDDQVEGIAHLLYLLDGYQPGPRTPIEPGVQLVIYGRGPLDGRG